METQPRSCHKMRAGQAGRAVLSMYFNLELTEGLNPASVPSGLSQPHKAFHQGYSLFPMLFQLWIAVRWERGQLLLTSLGLKQQQRHNILSVLPSTQPKINLCRSQLENITEKM